VTSSISSKKTVEGPQPRFETGLQSAEGDLAVVVGSDGDRGSSAEIEIAAIPYISLDNAPAADQLAACWRNHAGTVSSFGSRTRL
jgi:hypothetical protein